MPPFPSRSNCKAFVMEKIIRVIDIETLFEDPQSNGICEVGYTDVVAMSSDLLGAPADWIVGETYSSVIDPLQPIPAETSAVHHIIDADVVGAPTWADIAPFIFGNDDVIAYAAHGAKFERAWLKDDQNPGIPWIDTYRCAVWIYQDAPSFSNSGLRYHLRPEGLIRSKADPAHRAGPDSYVTAHHVRDMLNGGHSLEQLLDWTERPALLPRCKIGDYRNGGKGTLWKDVETSMLRWILPRDFDEDTKFTVRHHLEQREIDQREERERAELNRQLRSNGLQEVSRPGSPDADPSEAPRAGSNEQKSLMGLDL